MKLLVLPLLIAVAQPLPPLPRQPVNKQAENAYAKAQVPNERQEPANPSTSVIATNNCANENARADTAKNKTSSLHPDSQKQPQPWSRSDKLTLAYDILTALLVIIAAGTGIAVGWQAKKTAEATEAMQRSTHLQESGMQQWIQIAKLHGGEQSSEWEDGSTNVIFYFDIWNPTGRMLTLIRLKSVIGGISDEVVLNDVIPPNGAYPALVDYKLSGADLEAYKMRKPRELSITGEISFVDSLERKQVQPFNVWFHYALGTGVIMERYYSTAAWVLAEQLRATQKK